MNTWNLMRRNLQLTLATLLLTMIAVVSSTAVWSQDANFTEEFGTTSDNDKVTYSMGGEGEPATSPAPKSAATASKDTLILRPVQKIPDPAKGITSKKTTAEEEDDSVLSFNFLYYIIRKYKLQDIID